MLISKPCECGHENWRIICYKHGHSGFPNLKIGFHYSEWSKIICIKCNKVFSSRAKYVDDLPFAEYSCAYN